MLSRTMILFAKLFDPCKNESKLKLNPIFQLCMKYLLQK